MKGFHWYNLILHVKKTGFKIKFLDDLNEMISRQYEDFQKKKKLWMDQNTSKTMSRIKITDARWFITIGFIGLYLNLNDLISVLYFVLVQREKNKGSFSLSLVISNKLVSKTLSAKHTYFWWKKKMILKINTIVQYILKLFGTIVSNTNKNLYITNTQILRYLTCH